MNIAFGALAQYYAVEFEVFPGPDCAVLRRVQSVSGWWGGVWGRMEVKNEWKQLTNFLSSGFRQRGVSSESAKARSEFRHRRKRVSPFHSMRSIL